MAQYTCNFDPLAAIALQSRTRCYERWVDRSYDTGYRLWQVLRASKPLASNAAVSLVVWDEFFNVDATDSGMHKGGDRNRQFLGASWTASPVVKLEMGYMNQCVNTQTVDRMNHILSTTLGFNF